MDRKTMLPPALRDQDDPPLLLRSKRQRAGSLGQVLPKLRSKDFKEHGASRRTAGADEGAQQEDGAANLRKRSKSFERRQMYEAIFDDADEPGVSPSPVARLRKHQHHHGKHHVDLRHDHVGVGDNRSEPLQPRSRSTFDIHAQDSLLFGDGGGKGRVAAAGAGAGMQLYQEGGSSSSMGGGNRSRPLGVGRSPTKSGSARQDYEENVPASERFAEQLRRLGSRKRSSTRPAKVNTGLGAVASVSSSRSIASIGNQHQRRYTHPMNVPPPTSSRPSEHPSSSAYASRIVAGSKSRRGAGSPTKLKPIKHRGRTENAAPSAVSSSSAKAGSVVALSSFSRPAPGRPRDTEPEETRPPASTNLGREARNESDSNSPAPTLPFLFTAEPMTNAPSELYGDNFSIDAASAGCGAGERDGQSIDHTGDESPTTLALQTNSIDVVPGGGGANKNRTRLYAPKVLGDFDEFLAVSLHFLRDYFRTHAPDAVPPPASPFHEEVGIANSLQEKKGPPPPASIRALFENRRELQQGKKSRSDPPGFMLKKFVTGEKHWLDESVPLCLGEKDFAYMKEQLQRANPTAATSTTPRPGSGGYGSTVTSTLSVALSASSTNVAKKAFYVCTSWRVSCRELLELLEAHSEKESWSSYYYLDVFCGKDFQAGFTKAERNIAKSEALLLIPYAGWQQNAWVLFELLMAIRCGVPILPLIMEGSEKPLAAWERDLEAIDIPVGLDGFERVQNEGMVKHLHRLATAKEFGGTPDKLVIFLKKRMRKVLYGKLLVNIAKSSAAAAGSSSSSSTKNFEKANALEDLKHCIAEGGDDIVQDAEAEEIAAFHGCEEIMRACFSARVGEDLAVLHEKLEELDAFQQCTKAFEVGQATVDSPRRASGDERIAAAGEDQGDDLDEAAQVQALDEDHLLFTTSEDYEIEKQEILDACRFPHSKRHRARSKLTRGSNRLETIAEGGSLDDIPSVASSPTNSVSGTTKSTTLPVVEPVSPRPRREMKANDPRLRNKSPAGRPAGPVAPASSPPADDEMNPWINSPVVVTPDRGEEPWNQRTEARMRLEEMSALRKRQAASERIGLKQEADEDVRKANRQLAALYGKEAKKLTSAAVGRVLGQEQEKLPTQCLGDGQDSLADFFSPKKFRLADRGQLFGREADRIPGVLGNGDYAALPGGSFGVVGGELNSLSGTGNVGLRSLQNAEDKGQLQAVEGQQSIGDTISPGGRMVQRSLTNQGGAAASAAPAAVGAEAGHTQRQRPRDGVAGAVAAAVSPPQSRLRGTRLDFDSAADKPGTDADRDRLTSMMGTSPLSPPNAAASFSGGGPAGVHETLFGPTSKKVTQRGRYVSGKKPDKPPTESDLHAEFMKKFMPDRSFYMTQGSQGFRHSAALSNMSPDLLDRIGTLSPEVMLRTLEGTSPGTKFATVAEEDFGGKRRPSSEGGSSTFSW